MIIVPMLTEIGRIKTSFWTLDDQDIKILEEELKSSDEKVAEHAHLVAHQYRKKEFEELNDKASETLEKLEDLIKKALEAEKLTTLKWLSDSPIVDKQPQLRRKVESSILIPENGCWSRTNTPLG